MDIHFQNGSSHSRPTMPPSWNTTSCLVVSYSILYLVHLSNGTVSLLTVRCPGGVMNVVCPIPRLQEGAFANSMSVLAKYRVVCVPYCLCVSSTTHHCSFTVFGEAIFWEHYFWMVQASCCPLEQNHTTAKCTIREHMVCYSTVLGAQASKTDRQHRTTIL